MIIMVFATPLNNGQASYLRKALEEFPEVSLVQGYAERRGRVQPGYLTTDEPELLAARRERIMECANRAIAKVRRG